MRSAVWRRAHIVTDGFMVLSEVMYNSSLVKISMEYFLVEIRCSKVRNDAEVYPDIHKKRGLFRGLATIGIPCFTF